MSTNYYNKKTLVKSATEWGTAPAIVSLTDELTGFETISVDGGDREHLDNSKLSGRGGLANYVQAGEYKAATISLEKPVEFDRKFDVQVLSSILGQISSVNVVGVVTHSMISKKIMESSEILAKILAFFHTEGTECKVIPSWFPNEVSFKYANGRLVMSVKGEGSHYVVGSETDYTNILATTEKVYGGGYATFGQLVVQMNDTKDLAGDTESALSSSDNVKPSEFEIIFSRPSKALPVSAQEDYPTMPTDETGLMTTVKMKINTKDAKNATWKTKQTLAKSQKMKAVFTGGVIPGDTANYKITFEFSRLSIPAGVKYDFTTPTPVTIELKAAESISIPSGFTSELPRVEIVNTVTFE